MNPTKRIVQAAFLALTVGAVFLVGGNAERWCPFGGVEALYTYVHEGNMACSLGISNFFILGGVLLSVLLLRRAFCGYVCPIGTLSQWLGKLAGLFGIRPIKVSPWLDKILSLVKYAVLAVILYFTWRMGELIFRGYDPCYALISRHGEDITYWAYVVSGGIAAASLFLSVPFCRWLCPLAPVLNVFSLFGAGRVKRNEGACIDCGKCAAACPMAIPVDKVSEVKAARCTFCLSCVDACPKGEQGALVYRFKGGVEKALSRDTKEGIPAFSPGVPQLVLVSILLVVLAVSVSASFLFPLPSFVWSRGEAPEKVLALDLNLEELTCRGRANLLVYFLDRDDELALDGYIRLEAWPGPGTASVRIVVDSEKTNEDAVKTAVTESYFDSEAGIWRTPPFRIEGYDPLGLENFDEMP